MSLTLQMTTVAVLAGLGGVGAMAAQVHRGGRGLDHHSVELGVLTAAAVGLAGVGLLFGFGGLDGFGVVHLVYLAGVVTLPLLGLGLLVLTLRGRRPAWVIAVALVLVLPAPVGAYATHIAPYRLRVDRAELVLDEARDGDRAVRVGILSDIQTNHVGEHEREAVERLMALEPDVILVAGDLFQGSPGAFRTERRPMQELLGRLQAPGGVFFVRGDVDPRTEPIQALEGTDIRLLDDEVAVTTVGDRRLHVGGTRLFWRTPSARRVYEALERVPEGDVAILLAHRPDVVLDLPAGSRVDLTVAGHTHGGQVALPLLGPLLTMTQVPRSVAAGGLHEVDGHPIYVATGVGLERRQAPQVRFLTQPSVTLLTLR